MSEKHTLERIRKTKAEKEAFERSRKDNYKSPSGFVIMSRFMKEKNLEIINDFCVKHGLGDAKKAEMIEKYNKLNYYTPIVTPFLKIESAQFEK